MGPDNPFIIEDCKDMLMVSNVLTFLNFAENWIKVTTGFCLPNFKTAVINIFMKC